MALSANERQAIINSLVRDCDPWRGQGQTLATFPDETLAALKVHEDRRNQAVAVANAAVAGLQTDGGVAYRVNPETGKWEKRVVSNAPKKTVDDEEDVADEGDDEEEEDNPLEQMPKKARDKVNQRRILGNQSADDLPSRRRPRTTDDWLRQAPAEVQQIVNIAKTVEQREKEKLCQEILVNVSEADRGAQKDWLMRQPLDYLQNVLSIMPKQPSAEDAHKAASGGTTRNRRQSQPADDDMLVAPTLNWQEVDGKTTAQVGNGTQPTNGNGDGEYAADEDDAIRQLPARLRSDVMNAKVIVERERRQLIDDMVANLTGDEDQERRLVQRLNGKSLDELRDLAALTPRRSDATTGTRPNYFGSAAPLTNQSGGEQDDLLPVPSWNWTEVPK